MLTVQVGLGIMQLLFPTGIETENHFEKRVCSKWLSNWKMLTNQIA